VKKLPLERFFSGWYYRGRHKNTNKNKEKKYALTCLGMEGGVLFSFTPSECDGRKEKNASLRRIRLK
jgi:hypothetical protein